MAITKAITKPSKNHGGLKKAIGYVLQNKKIKDKYVYMTGPSPAIITPENVYGAMMAEKKIWHKDNGRMYTHNIISFHKDEEITADEALDFGIEFSNRWFSGFQTLISVHQDRDHIHIHFITNSVSYEDGRKYHTSKYDLEKMKEVTNDLCRERGLSIADKGKHFDGTAFGMGEITAWTKDKYQCMKNDMLKSYIADCALAVLESKESAYDKDSFITCMEERGWSVTWSENKKHIVFVNKKGQKVSDSNLKKTFNLNISKEDLDYEFNRRKEQNECEREGSVSELGAFDEYYSEVEGAINGDECFEQPEQIAGREQPFKERSRDIIDLEFEAELNDIRSKTGAIQKSAAQSMDFERQSMSCAIQRRLAEQQRTYDQRDTEELGRTKHEEPEIDR